jgi:hypothetical protein
MIGTVGTWIAPAATMIAAILTAANLGARITGWGFVVFTIGSVCWAVVGYGTGQHNLLATNSFLTLVNLLGIWRWLGRQANYEDGSKSAKQASKRSSVPTLFSATGVAGMSIYDGNGEQLGKAIEALIECASGKISYIVIASGGTGGIDEALRAVERQAVTFEFDHLMVKLDRNSYFAIPQLADGSWPAEARTTNFTARPQGGEGV